MYDRAGGWRLKAGGSPSVGNAVESSHVLLSQTINRASHVTSLQPPASSLQLHAGGVH
jgi:hypothetical protein